MSSEAGADTPKLKTRVKDHWLVKRIADYAVGFFGLCEHYGWALNNNYFDLSETDSQFLNEQGSHTSHSIPSLEDVQKDFCGLLV